MKLLRCRCCRGEMEIVGNDRAINKKVKCLECGFNNLDDSVNKEIEVFVIRKKI